MFVWTSNKHNSAIIPKLLFEKMNRAGHWEPEVCWLAYWDLGKLPLSCICSLRTTFTKGETFSLTFDIFFLIGTNTCIAVTPCTFQMTEFLLPRHRLSGKRSGRSYHLINSLDWFIFRERGREGKRGRETSMCCLSCTSYWGPDLQPRHVPWLGIEPVTLCFTVWCSTHWATPARARWLY